MRRSNAASKSWLGEGDPLQFVPDCARVMRLKVTAPKGGEEKPPVIQQRFSLSALKSRAIFFQECRETGRFRGGIPRGGKIIWARASQSSRGHVGWTADGRKVFTRCLCARARRTL